MVYSVFCWDFVDILPFSERSISFFLILDHCSLSFLPSDLSQVLLFFIFFYFGFNFLFNSSFLSEPD